MPCGTLRLCPKDARNHSGATALWLAASAGNFKVVQRMFDVSASVVLADNHRSCAARNGLARQAPLRAAAVARWRGSAVVRCAA
jgi:hypothetical protein